MNSGNYFVLIPKCATATKFFVDKNTRDKVWPLLVRDRKHILEQIQLAEILIETDIDKTKNPQKLILHKPDKLYDITQQKIKDIRQAINYPDGSTYFK